MGRNRNTQLYVAETVLQSPCFFPSVSSVKTNLKPVDYVELLELAGYPLFLISAYDIVHCPNGDRPRMDTALKQSKTRGSVILMDSGNYESFWKDDHSWRPDDLHKVTDSSDYHLCFCYDNQDPHCDPKSIAEDVVARVKQDQDFSVGTVIPIVHGTTTVLPEAARMVAEQLYPVLLAVPERELGEGIIERTRTVRRIREALDTLEVYCPLHLLGTGNPISIIAYALAGADSFDGLEWCQTTVDHETGKLLHFQQWDLICHQTEWGTPHPFPYIQSVLMHNLDFYHRFMAELHEAIHYGDAESYFRHYATNEQATVLIRAGNGGD